ncbi:hypothetical protein [Nocardioides plantarum]|uniref:Uncharacterized protein n=1 Tax=Nocardioides plantarum TaxID=29299 RepID=A0ABV5K6T5_9ACTN|nr:hypothetical protein [Nocardioides plantarum]
MVDRSELDTQPRSSRPGHRTISRRAVVGTAAWAAPTIAVVSAAPAFAASGDVIARVAPVSPSFVVNPTTATQSFTVAVTNSAGGVQGRNIAFSVSATSGESTTWLTFVPTSAATDASGQATAVLQFGATKPADGATYTVAATDLSDPSLQVVWTFTYRAAIFASDFNGIASGLPTGFTGRSGATASSVGTAATFTTAATAWADTAGAFKNSASATGLTSASTGTVQAASTNRAVGVRQSGGFGDPSAAFFLTIANTAGRASLVAAFRSQLLSNGPRTTVWRVEAGTYTTATGAIVGTPVLLGTITPTDTTADFNVAQQYSLPAAFDDLTPPTGQAIFVRVVTLAATTGSGNRDTFGIDDLTVYSTA